MLDVTLRPAFEEEQAGVTKTATTASNLHALVIGCPAFFIV
jgi:hypothetical protein